MSLAVKYRPQAFSEVVGQESVVRAFKRILESSEFFPSYILTGPFGSGKTTLARLLAKAALCKNRMDSQDPCGLCESCKLFDKGQHPCYQELDAASHGLVEHIRHIKEEAHYSPPPGYAKRFLVLDEAHMLTRQAQNAFLKLLEEGSRSMVFILVTTDLEKILPTVRSRCQVFYVRKPSRSQVVQRLQFVCEQEHFEYDLATLEVIAAASKGFLRNAITSMEMCVVNNAVDPDEVRRLFNLDLVERVARILLMMVSDRARALEEFRKILEVSSAKDVAMLIAEIVTSAVLYTSGCKVELLDTKILEKIAGLVGARAEVWVDRMSHVTTFPEFIVTISSLYDQLVGPSAESLRTYDELFQRAAKGRQKTRKADEPLTEDDVVDRLKALGLVSIEDQEEHKTEEGMRVVNGYASFE